MNINGVRIGMLVLDNGEYKPVIMCNNGMYKVWSSWEEVAPINGGKVVPLDEWKPPIMDGVWLCEKNEVASFVVILGGSFYDEDGYDIGCNWKIIERIGDIPESIKENITNDK